MAVYSGPNVSLPNLVYTFDVGNFKIYRPGAPVEKVFSNETTTVYNSPTYSSANGGFLSLDGIDDYIEFNIGSGNISTTMSIEILFKIPINGNKPLFRFNNYTCAVINSSVNDEHGVGFTTTGVDFFGGYAVRNNTWTHCVFEMRSDVSVGNNKIYRNGSLVSNSISIPSENSANRNFNNGVGIIFQASNFGLITAGQVSIFRIYRGTLSQEQINQNFNSVRGRVGL